MNKTYRLVWSDVQQTWVVTHEHVKTRGKRGGGRVGALLAGALLAPALHAAQPAVNALPTGGQVVAGQAAITQAGSTMNIQQATQKAILEWQSFNIGANATVNFQQPNASSVALNRVIGADPSAIFGRLSANGQVFLVNPNGVLFAPGAQVDVAGLVASTLNIRNEDFLAGNYRFSRDGAAGSVINQGNLTGGYLALLAPEVRNEGVILARMGTAALAAGDVVTLGITGENRVDVQVDKATVNTLVENRHLIQADAGRVVISAQSATALLGEVVNSGTIVADGLVADGGTIRLAASHNINHSGSISANAGANGRGGEVIVIADLANPASRTDVSGSISAKGGAQSGDGGFIETSASKLKIADSARIDTSAPFGATGQWLLDPYDFTIAAANGDITGTALGAALASSNVTIQTLDMSVSCTGATCTGTGNASGNGDIFVNDSVTWSSDKKLTLSAWRNVHINAPINVNGAGGGLALEFAQSGDFFSFPAGIYTVSAPVNLAAGTTFSTKAATDGPVIDYTVIRDATALAAISSGLTGNYVLGTDITAPGTSWAPIGNTATPFMGIFDGLGHKVTGLQHTNAGADVDVGLFGGVGAAGLLQNVGVTGVNIAGSQNVGALAGYNNGFIINSYATGTVQGTGAGNVGRIGGLVGFSPGPIQGSYANVTVTATSGNQSGNPFTQGRGGIGGLAGVVGSAVGDSYARGAVSGGNFVGGLVGYTAAGINNSYSTGAVTAATANVGGFAGGVDYAFNAQFIFNSFWDTQTSGRMVGGGSTDTTTGDAASGGLAGRTTAQMQTPSNFTAAGWNTMVDAWELRSGQYPLLKQMLQPIYVIADNKTSTFNGSAFTAFTSTTGPTGAPGGATTGSVTYTPSTASPTNAGTYTVTPGGVSVTAPADQNGYRVEFVNGTLVIDPAVLTTTITGSLVASGTQLTKVYDGSSTITGLTNANFSLSGWVGMDGATVTKTTGTITDGPNASASTTRPVTVTLVTGDFSPTGSTNFSNYLLPTSVSGNIGQITPKTVALSATKTYDGTTALTGSQVTITTGVGSESLTYSGATANSKNVADNASNFINAVTLGNGTGGLASNYQLPVLNNTNAPVTINKANLTLSGSRTYDATTIVAGSILTANGVNGETFAMTGAGDATNLASKNVVTNGALSTVTGLALGASNGTNPADAGNYNPITFTGSAVTINKLTLGVLVPPQPSSIGGEVVPVGTLSKVYDANSVATVTGVSLKPQASSGTAPLDRPYQGDTVHLDTGSASGQFRNGSNVAAVNAGDATTVAITGLALSGADSGNYELPATVSLPGAIRQRTVTLSATKTYDGTTALTGNQVTIGDLVGGQTLNYTGATASSKDVATLNKRISAITLADGDNGGLASNYRVPSTLTSVNAPVTINKANLTLSGTREYDATTVVAGSALTATGVNGETFAINGLGDSSNLVSKNASNTPQALATLTNLSLGASNGSNPAVASNYNPLTMTGSAVTVTKKTLDVWTEPNPSQVGGITPAAGTLAKVYDGSSTASLTTVFSIPALALKDAAAVGAASAGQPYAGDDVSINISGASGQFRNSSNAATANVLEATTVALSGLALSGTDSGNYQLPASPTLTGQILPRAVTLSAAKAFDGTTALTGTQVTIGNLVGTQTLNYSGATSNSAVVASNGSNFISVITLADGNNGGLASNYRLPTLNFANAPVTINPALLTITGSLVGSVSREYDGTNIITGLTNANFSLSGWATGDGATVTKTTGTITDGPNAGVSTTRPVTVTLALSDYVATGSTNFSNYTLPTSVSGNIGEITPKTVTLSGAREYNGNTALIGLDITLNTGVAGENLGYNGTANSKNVGPGNFINTITLYDGINGELASNYRLPTLNNANAPVTITPRVRQVTAPNVSKVYDGTTAYTTQAADLDALRGQFIASGDNVTAATIVFTDRNAGTDNKTVNLTAITINDGNGGNNYTLNLTGNSTSTITPKALSLLGIPRNMEIYAPPGFPDGGGAVVGQQYIIPTSLAGATPDLQTAIAPGTGSTTDGKPYTIDGPFTLSGTAEANTWTVTSVYQGLRSPNVSAAASRTSLTAPVTGLTLTGTGAGNYTVTGTSVSSSIRASLSVSQPTTSPVEVKLQTVEIALSDTFSEEQQKLLTQEFANALGVDADRLTLEFYYSEN